MLFNHSIQRRRELQPDIVFFAVIHLSSPSLHMAYMTTDEHQLRKDLTGRSSTPTPTIVLLYSESSASECECQDPLTLENNANPNVRNKNNSNSTLHKIVTSTTFQRRLSRQSSLPWGHKPSPIIGASCFLFLLPIPFLLRTCCPISACLLGCVTISSYLSDHVYTGLESWTHGLDRVMAPLAFASNAYASYCLFGVVWTMLSLPALKCHVWANYYSKKNMYDQFVIWHSLWHVVGVGAILICHVFNSVGVGKCWEGARWEEFVMNFS